MPDQFQLFFLQDIEYSLKQQAFPVSSLHFVSFRFRLDINLCGLGRDGWSVMSRSIENIVIEPERPRANSAPSVATLSTRSQGRVHYPHILNKPDYPDEGLLGGEESLQAFMRSIHNGDVMPVSTGLANSTRGSSGSARRSSRGPPSRLHQRRGTLGRALSISQEQKEKIALK